MSGRHDKLEKCVEKKQYSTPIIKFVPLKLEERLLTCGKTWGGDWYTCGYKSGQVDVS